MWQTHRRLWCHLAVVLAWPLAPFWLLFAVANYPWIVLADSDFERASSCGRAAATGVGMVFMSVVSILWAADVFGREAGNWGFASLLLSGLAFAGCCLYTTTDILVLASVALPAHAVGVIVVLLGAVGLGQLKPEPGATPDASKYTRRGCE